MARISDLQATIARTLVRTLLVMWFWYFVNSSSLHGSFKIRRHSVLEFTVLRQLCCSCRIQGLAW